MSMDPPPPKPLTPSLLQALLQVPARYGVQNAWISCYFLRPNSQVINSLPTSTPYHTVVLFHGASGGVIVITISLALPARDNRIVARCMLLPLACGRLFICFLHIPDFRPAYFITIPILYRTPLPRNHYFHYLSSHPRSLRSSDRLVRFTETEVLNAPLHTRIEANRPTPVADVRGLLPRTIQHPASIIAHPPPTCILIIFVFSLTHPAMTSTLPPTHSPNPAVDDMTLSWLYQQPPRSSLRLESLRDHADAVFLTPQSEDSPDHHQ